MLIYTAARLGLVLAVGALLYVAGARGWVLFVMAFLVSGIISIFALGRLRDQVSVAVSDKVDQAKEKRAATAHVEDDIY